MKTPLSTKELIDLVQNNKLDTKSIKSKKKSHKINPDHIKQFLFDLNIKPGRIGISRYYLYALYEYWCKTNSRRLISKKDFFRIISSTMTVTLRTVLIDYKEMKFDEDKYKAGIIDLIFRRTKKYEEETRPFEPEISSENENIIS